MLQALVASSLRLRGVVLALACVLLAVGAWDSLHARLDVFPDFVPPEVVIQTEAPGWSAEHVEALVTRPLEAAVGGTVGLEDLRSTSIQGLSILTAVFRDGTDVFRARQMLAELVASAQSSLPVGVHAPRLTPLTSATMDLLKIGLQSETLSPLELRRYAQWTLRPALLAIEGVAGTSVFGGEVERLEIQVLPERLEAFELSLADVVAAARNATGVRGAGFVENDNQRIVVRTEGQSLEPDELARAVVARRDGTSVTLGDVAHVVLAAEPKFGDALIQGKPGVLLTMLSQYGANTMEVTERVERALDELAPAMREAGIDCLPRLHRPATFVEHAIANLRDSLLVGAALVVAVLFLFLYDLRTALVSLAAIPLSLAAAVVVMHRFGVTLNTITLGGLAIALGEVVDDAIIDVENICRRLRENRDAAAPRSAFDVVLAASLEVRGSVVYATLIVVLVFIPVLTMSGLQGRMFAPLGVAYVLAVLASLVVALTVTPAMCLGLFASGKISQREFPLLAWARAAYGRLLARVARHVVLASLAALALALWAASLVPKLGGDLLPDFREGHFVLHATATPGTSLTEMKRLGALISERLLADPRIATVEQQIGRAELGEDPWGPNRSEFHVELAPVSPAEETEVAAKIREVLGSIPGISYDVLTFLGDRIGETITGETAAVVVSVFGDDLELLDAKGREVARELGAVRGAVDVQLAAPAGLPEIEARLRPERLAAFGFTPTEVLDAVETAFQGVIVAQAFRADRAVDIAVVLDPARRREPESVAALRVKSSEGVEVPLGELADVALTQGRSAVLHDGGRRRQTVTCNVVGRDVTSFVDEARARIAKAVELPRGTYVRFGGEAEARAEASRELALHASLTLVGVLLLLSLALGHGRNLALVLLNLPFALLGGVVAAWLGSGSLTLGALVGFVTLFGITTRNSIMLLSHFRHLVEREGCTWNLETALRGARERFAPIVMTATVTGLALLPLAIDSGAAGREIEGPMAAVILGGLVSSTLLNLFLLPSLALRFGRFGRSDAR
ncbi:MAG: efflux RND transporter permease subunit [Planctomycetes bacterium]|nr:efflux RND transporter permease subunit [Planctomycetota bacterium]